MNPYAKKRRPGMECTSALTRLVMHCSVAQICRHCSGLADGDIACVSLDCPMLYLRVKVCGLANGKIFVFPPSTSSYTMRPLFASWVVQGWIAALTGAGGWIVQTLAEEALSKQSSSTVIVLHCIAQRGPRCVETSTLYIPASPTQRPCAPSQVLKLDPTHL
jgi:hypothetical protein